MFRPFLSVIMPRFFPKRENHSIEGESAKLSNGSSSRDAWMPPIPYNSKNIQLTNVVKGNNTSQEMIINGISESPSMSDDTITKVVHFSVKYGSGESDVTV